MDKIVRVFLKKNRRVQERLKNQTERHFAGEKKAEEVKLMVVLEDSLTIYEDSAGSFISSPSPQKRALIEIIPADRATTLNRINFYDRVAIFLLVQLSKAL